MTPDWRQFEQTVAAFLQALDPSAKVSHDAQVPDFHTGLPRQRDVWIETSFGGHLPVKILVSCKRKKGKLSQQDIDAFCGELQSSGAHKGVLYSYGGFTKPALAKADRLGISCCALFAGRQGELPESLRFSAYCYREQVKLEVDGFPSDARITWTELLQTPFEAGLRTTTVRRELSEAFDQEVEAVKSSVGLNGPPLQRRAEIKWADPTGQTMTTALQSGWLVFRAKVGAWLINGSYSLSDKDFKGTFSTPVIDTWSAHPGPGWEEVSIPESLVGANVTAFYMFNASAVETLARWEDENGHLLIPTPAVPAATEP